MQNDNGRMNYGIGLDTEQLARDAAKGKSYFHELGQTAVTEGNRIDDSINKIGASIAGIFAISKAKEFVTNIASVRGEFQQLEMAFNTMLGSEEKASSLMKQLITTAATTPFGMTEVANSSKQLLAYGVEAEKVNETLIRLGDIAAGLSIPMNDLAYLYGTTMTQGRLYTQDLRQFMGRGIPLADELAKQFGVTKDKVGELVTAGKVGFPEVEKAIIAMTSEGGKFGGLMEAQSKTISGQISNIEDAIEQVFNTLGKESEDVISGVLSKVSNLIENYQEVGRIIAEVVAVYGTYKAAVIATTAIENAAALAKKGWTIAELAHYNALVLTERAQALLNKTMLANPYILAATAVAALTAYLYEMSQQMTEAEKVQEKINQTNKDFTVSVDAENKKIDELFSQLKLATKGTEQYEAAKKAILDQYGDYLSGLKTEISTLEDVAGAYDAVKTAALEAAKARAMQAATTEASDSWANEMGSIKEELSKALEKHFGNTKDSDGTLWRQVMYQAVEPYLNNSGKALSKELRDYLKTMKGTAVSAAIQNAIAKAKNANEGYDAKMNNAKTKFGTLYDENSNDGVVITGHKREKPKEPTDKEKKAAAKAEEQRKKEAQKKAEELKKERNQEAVEHAKYLNDKQERSEQEILQDREQQLEIRQGEIDAMKDGFDKEMKQNDLNYDRLILQNDRRKQEMIESARDAAENAWNDKNPKARENGQVFNRNEITDANLTDKQLQVLAEFDKIANEMRVKNNKDTLQNMLQDIQDYEQQRQNIIQDAEDKRNALYEDDGNGGRKLRDGVTQGNIDEINYQEQESLKAIDEQFASREEVFNEWCNEITNFSLKQLENLLEKAKAELDALEKSGNATSKQLSTARAKVNKIQAEVNKQNAKDNVGSKKRSIKEWEDLYKVLNDCVKEFDSIGNVVDSVAGKIISTSGSIATSTLSMINGIVQLVNMSTTGMSGTAQAASKAIKTVETASVVLTVISAAMSVATQIISLFNSDDSKQERIEGLQRQVDALQWELDNQGAIRMQERYGKALDIVADALKKTREEYLATVKATQGAYAIMWAVNLDIADNQELLAKTAEKVADAYANMAYTANKFLGENKYGSAREQLENISKQQILINEQIETEKDKKKTDWSKIEDWEEKIQELGNEALELINEMVEDIIGGSADDIAQELGDAFFEAFQDGEDYAEAWGDKVNDIVADVMKRMLVSKFLEEPLGDIFDKYRAKWFPNGEFAGLDSVIDSLNGFAADLNSVGNDFQEIWDALPDSVKGMFEVTDAAREGSSKGIASASQESIDETNGRLTAMQSHTYSICENTKLLLANTNAILTSVLNIERNTDRLEAIESNLRSVKQTADDISLKGVKIK